jgi:predicted CoA-binding protein
MSDWRANILTDPASIADLIEATKRIAVLGIKTEAQAGQPAFEVPRYMADHGYDVVPVPVYYPDVTEILGATVYRTVASVPGEIDMVNVFRRSGDVAAHVDDILAAKPKSVWLQLGIVNDDAAETFARAGIKVVQDRCLMVDHRVLLRRR